MLFEVGEGDYPPSPYATFRRNLDRLSLAGCSPALPASVFTFRAVSVKDIFALGFQSLGILLFSRCSSFIESTVSFSPNILLAVLGDIL